MAERTPMPDVIVLIPGILGSVLVKDGKTLWGPKWSAIAGVIPVWGKSLEMLTVVDDDPEHDLGDGISASEVMPDVHLIPGFWKIGGYSTTRTELLGNFDVTLGENLFEFPYDWRRDNRYSAKKLQEQADIWLNAWRTKSGNADAKLIIIGHSMCGLVARYFIEVLGGWKSTRALITFGTPYRGAGKALGVLVNGVDKAFGLVDASAFVRSLTSVYQLLPTYKCFDEGDGKLVHLRRANLPAGVDGLRVRTAWFEFHDRIAKSELANRAEADYPTFGSQPGFPIRAVVGLRSTTLSTGFLNGDKLELLADIRLQRGEGDGTVPRISATPTPSFVSSAYTSTKHASMQGVTDVLTDLFGFITSLYADVGTFLGPGDERPKATFDCDDAYRLGDSIVIDARLERPDRDHLLTATITPAGTGVARSIDLSSSDGETFSGELLGLEAGSYRIDLASSDSMPQHERIEPASDVFVVFNEHAQEAAVTS